VSPCHLFCQLILDYDFFDLSSHFRMASSSSRDGKAALPASPDRMRDGPVFRCPPRFRRLPPSLSLGPNVIPNHSQQQPSRADDTVAPNDINHPQSRTPLLDQSTPFSIEEIYIQVDSLREVTSGLMELICRFKAVERLPQDAVEGCGALCEYEQSSGICLCESY